MSSKATLTASVIGSGPKVFHPLASDHESGPSEIFAAGFGGPVKSPDKAEHRPSDLAVGADARFMYPTMYVDACLTRHDVLLLIALRSLDSRALHATECAYSSANPAGKGRRVDSFPSIKVENLWITRTTGGSGDIRYPTDSQRFPRPS
jgi:hypothetical protein